MSRNRSSSTTGVTLIEAAVVAGLATVAAATLAVWFGPRASSQDLDRAFRDAGHVQEVAAKWKLAGDGGCPTLSVLGRDRALSSDAVTDDPWGNRFRIVCDGDSVRVLSPGPDGKSGSADDVVVPKNM